MTTKAELIAWLKTSNSVPVILADVQQVSTVVGGASTTYYFSNRPYTTASTDTPSNTQYSAIINGGVAFSESLDLNGNPSIGVGDIQLDNTPVNNVGPRDAWLNYVWINKPIDIYIGDITWNKADFYKIFSGVVKDVDSKNRSSLNLLLTDRLQKLNVAVSETLLGGTTAAKDQIIPLTFGECFNVTPLLTDPATLTYKVHNGAVYDILEVRDNGAPVSITKSLSTGTFQLNQSPYGAITCSVQGGYTGTYSSKIGSIINNLLLYYGKTVTAGEVDTAQLTAFDSAIGADAGIYLNGRENLLDVCYRLANSIGAYLVPGLDGKFRLTQVKTNYTPISSGGTAAYSVSISDMEQSTLQISRKFDVQGAYKLAYCKNWTPQNTGLASAVVPASVTLFAREWFYTNQNYPTIASAYAQSLEPVQKDTLLIVTSQAQAECLRLLDIFKTPRYIYTATYYAHMLPVELGDTISITHPRFELTTGKVGTVVEINRDWLRKRVTIGVFI
jgi:hypothetical protein